MTQLEIGPDTACGRQANPAVPTHALPWPFPPVQSLHPICLTYTHSESERTCPLLPPSHIAPPARRWGGLEGRLTGRADQARAPLPSAGAAALGPASAVSLPVLTGRLSSLWCLRTTTRQAHIYMPFKAQLCFVISFKIFL